MNIRSRTLTILSPLLVSATLLLGAGQVAYAQVDSAGYPHDVDSAQIEVSGWKLGLVGGVTLSAWVIGHGVLNDVWWKGEPVPFHVNTTTDYTYALGADKVGHMVFAYSATTIYGDLFRWCGLDSATAIWSGAGVAMAYQTYVEVRDGFSAGYGFSWGDMAANTIGASLPVVKHYVPGLRPFDLQISFWPSEAFKNGEYSAIIDDYTSTTHWLAMNVYDVLPAPFQEWYPPWLGVALGHSVENIDGKGAGNHVWYVSLDWQLHRIEGMPSWLTSILRDLHLYHLPAPAVKVYPEVVWYGLRF
jgi:hypothetical protein